MDGEVGYIMEEDAGLMMRASHRACGVETSKVENPLALGGGEALEKLKEKLGRISC